MLLDSSEFERRAKGLRYTRPNLSYTVIAIERITADYFRSGAVQRCIVQAPDGTLYVSSYD
jgi:hypothetical protein